MLSIAPEAIAPVRVPLTTPALGAALPVGEAELPLVPLDEHAASTRAAVAARARQATRGRLVSLNRDRDRDPDRPGTGGLYSLAITSPILYRSLIRFIYSFTFFSARHWAEHLFA
jgi:hypothetical protein